MINAYGDEICYDGGFGEKVVVLWKWRGKLVDFFFRRVRFLWLFGVVVIVCESFV